MVQETQEVPVQKWNMKSRFLNLLRNLADPVSHTVNTVEMAKWARELEATGLSYQLRQLEKEGLISVKRKGRMIRYITLSIDDSGRVQTGRKARPHRPSPSANGVKEAAATVSIPQDLLKAMADSVGMIMVPKSEWESLSKAVDVIRGAVG